jgi:signal transduction histidine kinase
MTSTAVAVIVLLLALSSVLALSVRRTTERLDLLSRRVASWTGSRDPQLLDRTGWSGATGRLAERLDVLARSSAQRMSAMDAERPWRLQLVDALTQPALLFDADGHLQAANSAARTLTELDEGRLGMSILESTASAGIAEAAERVQRTRGPLTVDVERAGRDLRVSISLIGDETLVLLTDRTRERQVEDLRRDFVVNASHELKTPVTAIQTLGEAIAVTIATDPGRAVALVKHLNVESERLGRLVGDLLDLRRLEVAGPLERVPVDLAETVRLVVAELIPRAEARAITIEVDVPDAAPVAGVPADLEAVAKNLISNAVKYNREGGTIHVRLRTHEGSRVLRVEDTGIGMRQQDLPRIFERFYRVDTARSRETGGTGLGLSIVRHAVERQGGSVQVESTLGEGTAFTVTLPIDAHA